MLLAIEHAVKNKKILNPQGIAENMVGHTSPLSVSFPILILKKMRFMGP
jgi:hypothetical protein